jgi:succinoglycan biosynthesis transport protein ExoP
MTDKLDKFAGRSAVRSTPPGRSPARRIDVYPMADEGPDLNGGELLVRIKDVLARRWPVALAVVVVIVSGVALGVQARGPLYRATGVIEIRSAPGDTPSIDALLAARRVSDEMLETEVGILESSALAERVIDKLNLGADPIFNPSKNSEAAMPPDAADAARQRQALINRLRDHLIIDPQQGRLVAVSYDAPDPALAARVVNGVFDSYFQWRHEDATRTAKWLSTQIADAQKQLQASEKRLQAHVRRNGLQIIETGKGESANLVNERLRQLHGQLADMQADRYQKQSAFESAASGTGVIDHPVIQSLTVRLADLQREYASLSSTFLDDYPKVQQLKQQIAQVQKSLDEEVKLGRQVLQNNYQSALRREALLQEALATQQNAAVALTGDVAGYEALKREVQTNQQLYSALDEKLKDVTIAAGLRATNMGIVDRASATAASSLRFPLSVTLSLAACVGLLLGLGLVFVQEQTDSSVRSVTEVGAHLGMPALAVIPAVAGRAREIRPSAASAHLLLSPAQIQADKSIRMDVDGRSQAALSEAFAALRTSVMLNNGDTPPRSMLITSASPGEGKTTVAVNLAMSLARLSERVLLIDFDVRRPSVAGMLQLDHNPGLSNCLIGDADWRTCVQAGPVARMDVMTTGALKPQEAADMAMSPRLRELLAEAEAEYDFVIVDSAPVGVYPADVRTLASLVDGTLLTVRSGLTSREVVREAWLQLTRPLGVVLNGASPRDVPRYDYSIDVPPAAAAASTD